MREFDPFPQAPSVKRKADKNIFNKIAASYRDKEFYDGSRENGYGGFKDDGRWGAVADQLIKVYGLTEDSLVLQINCHKGFLLDELLKRGVNVRGTEVSRYAIECASYRVQEFITQADFTYQPFPDKEFDLVLAVSPVYAGSLGQAIKVLKEIERVGKGRSFVSLGTYEKEEDYWLLKKWYTLGTLVLRKDEWIEVLNHCGYRGDYRFDTAQFLNLE
jgi:ubiquinone/menaquinone biosynthesis C-methylase UbiE